MSRYHVCVKKRALHFGAVCIEEALELAHCLRSRGKEVEIVDNLTGQRVEPSASKRQAKAVSAT